MQEPANKGMQMIKVNKKNIIKYIHIAVIILGTVFTMISCFHTSVWFDESYSVAISKHSFIDIWNIGSKDVHPVLYYMMLKIVGLITNRSILAYRLFSCIPLIILAILGVTHVKKDFGEKTGLIFSFLILFMPVTLIYSGEIRMYTWAMLFVTITALYGYRIYKSGISIKNWIIFSIFSLLSAYTHYYALITVAVINISLFIYFLVNNIKQRNYEVKYIKYSKNLRNSIISAIIQIILYLPWIGTLLGQFGQVSKGFWIGAPNFLEIFKFQFTGNLDGTNHINPIVAYVFCITITIYMIYLFIRNWKDCKPAKIAMSIYLSVIIIALIISLRTPILYARYFLNMTGIFLFALAFVMAKDKSKITMSIIVIFILIAGILSNIDLMKENYDKTNNNAKEFIEARIQKDDLILVNNNLSGFVMSAYFPDNEFFFYDLENWQVQDAYRAFGRTETNLDSLKEYKGRIWVISEEGMGFLKRVVIDLRGGIKLLESEQINIKYQNNKFSINLIERK